MPVCTKNNVEGQYNLLFNALRAVVCKIRTILKSHCHTISPNWLKIGM